MAKLKAEFLQHYYDANGVPFRSRLIANFTATAKLGSIAPGLYNWAMDNPLIGGAIKKLSGFAVERSMPHLAKQTLRSWFKKHRLIQDLKQYDKSVYLFCDEFTNYNDAHIGIKAVQLLNALGYAVKMVDHNESGRTWLSKGLVRKAKEIANQNIQLFSGLVSAEQPLVGIEPSAILTFRDEYPDLATDEQLENAKSLAKNSFYIDEFLAREIEARRINTSSFTAQKARVILHGHCQQKAVGSLAATQKLLSFPENYTVEPIPSGCCGMAGSFGYEKEHYDVSMKIGELVLFPAIRNKSADTIIAAPGTSCRHQIKDGTKSHALHPVEILFDALVK
jgi:Fe-S oxidoreductase